jgi:hypothetical protein
MLLEQTAAKERDQRINSTLNEDMFSIDPAVNAKRSQALDRPGGQRQTQTGLDRLGGQRQTQAWSWIEP